MKKWIFLIILVASGGFALNRWLSKATADIAAENATSDAVDAAAPEAKTETAEAPPAQEEYLPPGPRSPSEDNRAPQQAANDSDPLGGFSGQNFPGPDSDYIPPPFSNNGDGDALVEPDIPPPPMADFVPPEEDYAAPPPQAPPPPFDEE